MTTTDLPVLGAAMPIAALDEHRDWLIADQRDVEIQDACLPDTLDSDWTALTRRAREALDGHTGRRGLHAPFDGIALMSKDKKVRALASERLCQALRFGAEFGASHMVVHSPFMFFGSPFLPHSRGFEQETQIELVHATLATVLPLAREIGCTLVFEGIQDKHPGPLLALVASFESELVRMSLDVGHGMITNRLGGPPVDQWVREAGPLIGHLHIQDSDGNIDRHWPPGRGQMNWYALFEALGQLSHRPRLILEIKQKDQIRAGAAWLAEQGYVR
jgi:sugar phosphate isomerase/epimerase